MTNPDDLDFEHELENSLADQATEIIDADTDWLSFARDIDVARYKYGDDHPNWRQGTPFRPMFLAYLYSEVEDTKLGTVRTILDGDPELAAAFGFDPDDLPSESTFRPCRVEDRFTSLQSTVEDAAVLIREVSVKRGAPLGAPFTTNTEAEADEEGLSKRSRQRLLRKRGREVLEELHDAIFPVLDIPRPDEPVYDEADLLKLEAIGAIKQDAANNSGDTLGDLLNPDPDLDDPYYEDGPTGETFLEAVKQLSVDEIAAMMNFALQKTYTRAKPTLKNVAGLAWNVAVAVDVTYVGYYGTRDEMEWLQGTPDKNKDEKSYDWCHKFATISIVGDNVQFVVGVVPLGSTEYADNEAYPGSKEQGHYKGDIMRRLLKIANKYVDVGRVVADREFDSADVLHTLDEQGVYYLIPASGNDRLNRICDRFDSLKKGQEDNDRDTPMIVAEGYAIHGAVKGKTSNTRVETNLVVMPPDDDDETHEEGSPQPFYTNLEVDNEIRLDRERTAREIEKYDERAGIENSYSSIKECGAWTTSKAFEVRWFHFGFACIVYNLWLLVDLLAQDRIGEISTRTKPRITLQRFLNWLGDHLRPLR